MLAAFVVEVCLHVEMGFFKRQTLVFKLLFFHFYKAYITLVSMRKHIYDNMQALPNPRSCWHLRLIDSRTLRSLKNAYIPIYCFCSLLAFYFLCVLSSPICALPFLFLVLFFPHFFLFHWHITFAIRSSYQFRYNTTLDVKRDSFSTGFQRMQSEQFPKQFRVLHWNVQDILLWIRPSSSGPCGKLVRVMNGKIKPAQN